MQTNLLVSDDAGTKEHQSRFNSSCDICWNLQAGSCSSTTTIAWQLLIEKETPDNHEYFRLREKTEYLSTNYWYLFLLGFLVCVHETHAPYTPRGRDVTFLGNLCVFICTLWFAWMLWWVSFCSLQQWIKSWVTLANLTPVQHRVLTSFYQLTKELQNSPPQKTYGVIAINNNYKMVTANK